MKSVNTYYSSVEDLKEFVDKKKIEDCKSLLIQIFTGLTLKDQIKNLLLNITTLFPNAVIIGSTTDGEIMDGHVSTQKTVVSFTKFDTTELKYYGNYRTDDGFIAGVEMAKELIEDKTKALISFASGLDISGEAYLNGVNSVDENTILAGGLAGDNANFENTYVFTKDEIYDKGVVAVALNSEHLNVYNEYAYSWHRVGVELQVTSVVGNRVYTINNTKAYDIYAHYLGNDIAKRLPESGTEFPLVIIRDGFSISRAVMSVEEDGSLVFAGNLDVGDTVQFGYGDIKEIFEKSHEVIEHVSTKPAEAIFVYSCMARRHYLADAIEKETLPLQNISPTAGFFTYGEFFSSKNKEFLNQTMTLLVLSESNEIKEINKASLVLDETTSLYTSINALANIARVTSKELNKKTTELLSQKETLYHQANHDSLTGLPNRVHFNSRLKHAINLGKRHKQKHALLFIDLDDFKIINDSMGHDMGDRVLKMVTHRLDVSTRDEDALSRFGGDEFALLLEDIDSIDSVSVKAQRVLDILSQEYKVDEHIFHISSSIGISIFPDDGEDVQGLLKNSDVAMYKAKDEGKNNFQFYSSEMTKIVLEKIDLERNLREAIVNEEFEIYYQPKINGFTREVIGVEALIRWIHPIKGFISPDKFIPHAEKSGLIIEIDTWVMSKSMEQVSKWKQAGVNPGVLSLNLAIKQLESESYLETLKSNMQRYSFKASWLQLEVLERDIMKEPEKSIGKLQEIASLGIGLAIDDFGTGQSSFTYLKRFPLSELKIDKSFVDGVPGDEEDNAIVRAVIALAKALNLETIAEGVETVEQLEFLLENGCHNIQGYYFSKPLNSVDAESFLKRA